MDQPKLDPPVSKVNLTSPYPHAKPSFEERTLESIIKPGLPTVLHLYTG